MSLHVRTSDSLALCQNHAQFPVRLRVRFLSTRWKALSVVTDENKEQDTLVSPELNIRIKRQRRSTAGLKTSPVLEV